jgi:hypothetical protein
MSRRYIAIDPGVGTGVATYADGVFRNWESYDLREVADDVLDQHAHAAGQGVL